MTIAIIGASADRRKFGNKAVRAWLRAGETVVPINPKGGEIEGLPVVKSVLDYEGEIDTASVYLPPQLALAVLDELAEKKIPEVFINPGAESEALIERAKELGINAMLAYSIIGAGSRPGDFGDE
ncbi:MAG TPA: CoA-binding protein [Armatimonadota bacterium]|nr:CoA-binding protein [Armatimonadota bacterium]